MTRRLMDRLADRDRGILTQADRDYLRDRSDLQPQSERKRRQQIRERVWNALFDVWILNDHLPERDWEGIFDQARIELHESYSEHPPPYDFIHDQYRTDPPRGTLPAGTTVFAEALIDLFAFGCRATRYLSGVDTVSVAQQGLNKALRDTDQVASITVHDVTEVYLRQRLETNMFSLGEFRYLLEDYQDVAPSVLGDPLEASGESSYGLIPDAVRRRRDSQPIVRQSLSQWRSQPKRRLTNLRALPEMSD